MGNEIKDIDVVLDLPSGGIRFAEWMEKNHFTFGSVVTYPTYGTAMFKLASFPDVEIECVQTRKEQYHDESSRNPETAYGTLEEDVMRRDLTINSLLWNISKEELIDITGNGLKDIHEHRIRVTSTPDIVYSDDPLRILRCVRFYSRFHGESTDWYIEETTLKGMYFNVDRLSIITKERIADELNKMLLCKDPVCAMKLLKDIGAMKYVIPELEETFGMKQNKYHFGNVWEHTLKVLDNITNDCLWPDGRYTLVQRMSALLHDIGKIKTRTVDENGNVHFYQHELASADMCDVILRRLKYSNEFIKDVQFLVKNHMRTKQWGDDCSHMKDKSLHKFQYECGDKYYGMLLSLIDADNKAHAPEYCLNNQCRLIDNRTVEMIVENTDMFGYRLPIDGNDVMVIKGLKPGREVKECLDYALKLAFNNPKIDKETLLKHIKGYKVKKN
jgi:poly(A) polymerase